MDKTAQTFTTETTDLAVRGMTCGNCVRHVTEAIQSVGGVGHATVSLDTGRAAVKWKRDAHPDVAAVIGAIEKAGYQAEAAQPHDHTTHRLSDWQLTLWVGLLCTLPLLVGEWAFGLATQRWFQWLSFILATIVQVFCGARFYRGAW